jgi:hypothetical protein
MESVPVLILMGTLMLYGHAAGRPDETLSSEVSPLYSEIQETVLRQDYPLAMAIAKRELLEVDRDWNQKRLTIEILLAIRPMLFVDNNFSESFVRLNRADCQDLQPGERSCKGSDGINFTITEKAQTEELAVVAGGKTIFRHTTKVRFPFPGNRSEFGQKIHVLKDRLDPQGFYFIVREIEAGRNTEDKGKFVHQVLNFFKLSKSSSCKFGEALVDRHDKYYESMTAVIKIFGKSATCKEGLIVL